MQNIKVIFYFFYKFQYFLYSVAVYMCNIIDNYDLFIWLCNLYMYVHFYVNYYLPINDSLMKIVKKKLFSSCFTYYSLHSLIILNCCNFRL